MWDMTAGELDEQICAGRKRDETYAAENERLAFNIGALVLAAFNAPRKFPRTPDEAFGRYTAPADGGKSELMCIARQLNERLRNRTGENQ